MKKLLLFGFGFTILYSCSSGTSKKEGINIDTISNILLNEKSVVMKYDTISLGKISISGVPLLSNEYLIFKSFGKPDSTKNENGDLDEGQTIYKYYKKSYFQVRNKKIEGFYIENRNFIFDHLHLKIGDSTDLLKNKFPNSFKNRIVKDLGYILKIRVGNTDSYILFNLKNEKVVSFETWDDL